MTRTAGVVLLVGAGLFCAVAFAPASYVFGIPDEAARRAYLQRWQRSWRWGQVPFALGAVVSAVGLLVLGLQLESAIITLAGGVAVLASLPWAHHCYLRAFDVEGFLEGRLPSWQFRVYVWGTVVPLAATGLALLAADWPTWSAWLTVASAVTFGAIYLRFRDIPPFTFYVVTAVLGGVAL